MNGLNKNGRKYFDQVLYNKYDSAGKTLAITLSRTQILILTDRKKAIW